MSRRHFGLLRSITWLIAALATYASAAGLLVHPLYGDMALGPAMRGQDLLTLLVSPLLVFVSLQRAHAPVRASLRLGLLGYLLYTYTGAAFAYPFNALFLVYIALFSLCATALWLELRQLDLPELSQQLGARAPRRAAVFLLFVACVLAVSELSQVVSAHVRGDVPVLIARSQGAGNFVYVLDLGVVMPLSVLAAVLLLRAAPLGDVLGACLLVKSATMGMALVFMGWFSARAGLPEAPGLSYAYALIAVLGVAMSGFLLWPRRAGDMPCVSH